MNKNTARLVAVITLGGVVYAIFSDESQPHLEPVPPRIAAPLYAWLGASGSTGAMQPR